MIQYLKDQWNRFQLWVASKLPNLKTKLVTGVGAIASYAALVQTFVGGLPLDQLVSQKTLVIIGAVLFTLAFWFRHIADKLADDV